MAGPSAASLADGVVAGSRRTIGRLVSLLEAEDPAGLEALERLHPRTGRAHVIGVTGSPGTGKSTLVDRLTEALRRQGRSVGVVAVDPSSPFTGGAILGDRIRMQSRSTDPEVFIRSMGTRGSLGGLSAHTAEAVHVLDAAGKDVVLVETVGVGQAEVDIVRLADTVVVVLVPNLGDDVQAAKAGLMEIADVFVVNKSDLDGADKVAGEVEASLMLAHPEPGAWTPPIVRAAAERGHGVSDVLAAIEGHRAWAVQGGAWQRRRRHRLEGEVRSLLQKHVLGFAFRRDGSPQPRFEPLFREGVPPHGVARRILECYREAR